MKPIEDLSSTEIDTELRRQKLREQILRNDAQELANAQATQYAASLIKNPTTPAV